MSYSHGLARRLSSGMPLVTPGNLPVLPYLIGVPKIVDPARYVFLHTLGFVLALFHYSAGFKSQIEPKHFLHCFSLHFWSLLFQVICVLHILSRGWKTFTSGMLCYERPR